MEFFFILISTLLFLFMGIIWRTRDITNVLMKMMLIIMCLYGVILMVAKYDLIQLVKMGM